MPKFSDDYIYCCCQNAAIGIAIIGLIILISISVQAIFG